MPATCFVPTFPIGEQHHALPCDEIISAFLTPRKKRPRENSREDAYDFTARSYPSATGRQHKRARCGDYAQNDTTTATIVNNTDELSVAKLPPTYSGSSIDTAVSSTSDSDKIPLVQFDTDKACFAEPAKTDVHSSTDTIDNHARSVEVLLPKAQVQADAPRVEAARAANMVHDLIGALNVYSNAIAQQGIDFAGSQAAVDQARDEVRKAEERVAVVTLSAEDTQKLHSLSAGDENKRRSERLFRKPSDDPTWRRWNWNEVADTFARRHSEAEEELLRSVNTLNEARAKKKASQECLRGITALQAQSVRELFEASRSAKVKVLHAVAARAEEEGALLAGRAREEERAARADAEAPKKARHEQAVAAEKTARNKKARSRGGVLAARSERIKASRLNTLGAVCDVFEECIDPDNFSPQDQQYPARKKRGRASDSYTGLEGASSKRTRAF